MTFQERVSALDVLGFSERQTQFIVTVALHSGFCLCRHYVEFAGLQYGAGVRDFFGRLVARKLARRLTFRRDRGHVYHLHASSIYERIGQPDNRNRRHASAALIARRMMLLDYVLEHHGADWYATEDDKVALFETRLGLSKLDFPRRRYVAGNQGAEVSTTRYFIHKLPIALGVDGRRVTLVYLMTDPSLDAFRRFIEDHSALLDRLDRWRIVVVGPKHSHRLMSCQAVLRQVAEARSKLRPVPEIRALDTYFSCREARDRGDFASLTDPKCTGSEWHDLRRRFAAMEYEILFDCWKARRPVVLVGFAGGSLLRALKEGRGELVIHCLAVRYDRFGSRPGVS